MIDHIGSYQFADGTVLTDIDFDSTTGQLVLIGDYENDAVQGSVGDDYISALAGDDVVYALAGNDTVVGGEGADKIYAGSGFDVVSGGAGNDTLYGEDGADQLYGGDGDDVLVSGATTRTVYGDSVGNSILAGGQGNDLYRIDWDLGLGYIVSSAASEGLDDVVFNGVSMEDVSIAFDQATGDLQIAWTVNNLSSSLNIAAAMHNHINSYQFADGTKLTNVDIDPAYGHLVLTGADADDTIYGSEAHDYIFGMDGRDTLVGRGGADTIFGDFPQAWSDLPTDIDLSLYAQIHLADGANEGQYQDDGWGHRIGDFNNDGLQDIIQIGRSVFTENLESDGGRLEVLFANGNGSFDRQQAIAPHALNTDKDYSQFDVLVADFNGDGTDDVAWVLNSYGDTGGRIETHFSNGDGTFTGSQHLQPHYGAGADYSAFDVITGDFNGDGKSDLAWVLNSWGTSGGRIEVHHSNGDGTYTQQAHQQPNAGADYSAFDVLTGDYNGDGKTDLAWVLNSSGSTGGRIETHLSNGDGSFTFAGHIVPNSNDYSAFDVVTGDFNGDTLTDFAWVLNSSGTTGGRIETHFSYGDGTYANGGHAQVFAGADYSDWDVMVGDFDGDGRSDFAWTKIDQAAGEVQIATQLSYGTGSYQEYAAQTYSIYTGTLSADEELVLTTGDFNGDGRVDFSATVEGRADQDTDLTTLYSIDGITFGFSGNADTLIGGEGNDILIGGAGADRFVFDHKSGNDRIFDFQAGRAESDAIEFEAGMFADFADVLSSAEQIGSDVVISYDGPMVDAMYGPMSLTLHNVDISQLHENDFQY